MVVTTCSICGLEILVGVRRAWNLEEPVHLDCLNELHHHLDEEHMEAAR